MQVLQRCLNARQFGLKMIANVSYGYTSASFSGRMPFAELADAIVQVRSPVQPPMLAVAFWPAEGLPVRLEVVHASLQAQTKPSTECCETFCMSLCCMCL